LKENQQGQFCHSQWKTADQQKTQNRINRQVAEQPTADQGIKGRKPEGRIADDKEKREEGRRGAEKQLPRGSTPWTAIRKEISNK